MKAKRRLALLRLVGFWGNRGPDGQSGLGAAGFSVPAGPDPWPWLPGRKRRTCTRGRWPPRWNRFSNNPFAVLNKAGAGGALGCQFVATSKTRRVYPAPGLSMYFLVSRGGIFSLTEPPFIDGAIHPHRSPERRTPTILVVKSDSPWKTVADLGRRQIPSQEIRYSSAGFYSTLHLAMEMFSKAAA